MMLFPESLGKLRFLPLLLLIALIVGTAAIGWYFWQESAIANLRQDIAAGKNYSASQRAKYLETLGLKRREIQLLKAQAMAPDHPEEALAILEPLLDDHSAVDYQTLILSYLSIALDAERSTEAGRTIQAHQRNLNHIPDFLYQQARFLHMETKNADATRVLDRLLSIEPDHAAGRLLQAQILLETDQLINRIRAKVNLRIAARSDHEASREALRLLATRTDIPLFNNDRIWLAHQLRGLAPKDPRMGILTASQELMINPENHAKTIQDAVSHYGKYAPEFTASWLLSIRAMSDLQSFIQSAAGQKLNPDAKLRYQLEIALTQKNFDQAQLLLSQMKETEMSELQRLTLLAMIEPESAHDSQPPRADQWQQAYKLAVQSKAPDTLTTLARLATRAKRYAAAQDAYAAALSHATEPQFRAQLLSEKITVDLNNQDTTTALQDVREFLDIHPQHNVMLNNLYYLSALLGQEPGEPMEYPTDQLSQELDGVVWSTYALSMWRAGNFELAREALDKLPQKYHAVPSAQLITLLVALELNDLETAQSLANKISADMLLPEEKQLLQQARQRLQS